MISLIILLNAYFVSFIDKPEMNEPALSPRAIEQREKWNIALDALDYPVNADYVDSLQRMGVKVYHTSRWFNGATVEMDETLAEQVAALDFVAETEMTRNSTAPGQFYNKHRVQAWQVDPSRGDFTEEQLALFNLIPLHKQGYKGEGIVMTICDGGFHNANTLDCFRQEELELGHFDFTDDKDDFYGYQGDHGTMCLSTISGRKLGFTGAATEAQYYLMRSEEYATESPKEMDNLVAALEKSDSLGVNVFSVSLGYAEFDNGAWTLPKSALDGVSTRASRAATIAARKGMLVCVAAGNEGYSSWSTISVPADADSILTVGAVDTEGNIGGFSSYGYSADGRVKPEVCAVGVETTLINPSNTVTHGNGTSFATPLIAGMSACLWSAFPDEPAMKIRERIILSADRYNNPDTHYGYGIPDAWQAYSMFPSDNNEIQAEENVLRTQKVIRGDQILVIRHGHVYNLAGQRVE